jgi:hypothetical protein
MTDEFAEWVRRDATLLLGDGHFLRSVHVVEGWGGIFWATLRLVGPRPSDHCEFVTRLKSAARSVFGELRHVVRIEWE